MVRYASQVHFQASVAIMVKQQKRGRKVPRFTGSTSKALSNAAGSLPGGASSVKTGEL